MDNHSSGENAQKNEIYFFCSSLNKLIKWKSLDILFFYSNLRDKG